MGLLNYLTATSLDEDYAQAHAARARAAAADGSTDATAAGERRSTRPRTAAMVVLALFGLLVATAAVQTSRGAADADARHAALVKQVVARNNVLADERDRARSLRSETETLQRVYLQATAQGRALQTRLTRLGVVTGAAPARGPGVRIVVDDGPPVPGDDNQVLDVDLQKMVNGLWLSGAEAISINGERLTSLSAIRLAGGVMTVNYHRISPPYTIEAIGNPDNLAARFVDTPGGQWWLDLQALYGLQFEINTVTDQEPLTLPAARRTALRHAHTPETLR
jgi:uncharacterized protein YlxW (UPF0749 family)